MEPCETIEEELTVDLPLEAIPIRSIALVEPVPAAAPPSPAVQEAWEDEDEPTVVEPYRAVPALPREEAPIPRALKQFFGEWRRQLRLAREYESRHHANTLYQQWRRWMLRCIRRMKKNSEKSWQEPYVVPATLGEIFREWRRQSRLTRENDSVQFSNTLYQKARRLYQRCMQRARANAAKSW